jgi:hypothetical protein
MLQAEYIRILNCNYERILLSEIPDIKRYQYCILGRGGIKGLLPCNLRYIDNAAYLYYDISSTQNVAELYAAKKITREWIKDFLWSMRQVQAELDRFLLDDRNLLWFPQHIFQDLSLKEFRFLYIPYYGMNCGFLDLLEFWVEHIDYNDKTLVDYIYKMYSQYELLGSVYLEEQIFEDAQWLEKVKSQREESDLSLIEVQEDVADKDLSLSESPLPALNADAQMKEKLRQKRRLDREEREDNVKKGLIQLLSDGHKKHRKDKKSYQRELPGQQLPVYAVCEALEEEEALDACGKTIYIEEKMQQVQHFLYSRETGEVVRIQKEAFLIGKQQEEVDLCLPDQSASRIHARITNEGNNWYLEDLNATNGTFKNGLRMNPYEKRILEAGDEIKFGRLSFLFR